MIKDKLSQIFNKDYIFFRLVIFFIPSAFPIAGFLIIITLISQTIKRRHTFLNDKLNIFLIVISLLMLSSCIVQNLLNKYDTFLEIENYLTWVGLFNWIPFFWVFWSSQEFFKTKNDRNITSSILIFSTIPLIISGILQYYFDFVGPYKFLNGLIIWYQRPIDEISGLTGFFNHANYAGAWLVIILPFVVILSSTSNIDE